MIPFLPLCLKMYIACDLAVAFALGIDEIHVYTQGSCGTFEYHVEQLLAFCVIVINISVVSLLLLS